MDLSDVPELQLRQKVKPIYERARALNDEIDRVQDDHVAKHAAAFAPLTAELKRIRETIQAKADAVREQTDAVCAPLIEERDRLEKQLDDLLGEGRAIECVCHRTGLPIFDDDETGQVLVTKPADATKAAA